MYSLSDLHADSSDNMIWVRKHCSRDPSRDNDSYTVFICAGDIASGMDAIIETFRHLAANYDAVAIYANTFIFIVALTRTVLFWSRSVTSQGITIFGLLQIKEIVS